MPSKLEGNSIGHINQIKTEAKLEMKQEPLYDLYMVHDNSNLNVKPTKEEENLELKKESYFDEVFEETAIDFVTSKTFDKDYLKLTKNQHNEETSSQSSSKSNSQNLHGIKKAKCLQCDKKFSQKSTLHYHNKVVHEKKDDSTLSKVHERRNKSFDTNASLERNLEMKPFFCKNKDKNEKTGDKKGKLKCSQCDHTYNKECNLKHHVKIVHERKNFIGREIDAVFKSRKELKTNKSRLNPQIKEDHEKQQFRQNCPLCSRTFSRMVRLNTHMVSVHGVKYQKENQKEVHEKQSRLNCSLCSRTFSHIGRLNAHMVSFHEGKKSK